MRIALGPVLYFWSKETLQAFYQRMVDTPVNTIYIGETVCSKRRSFRVGEWVDLGRELAARGKTVRLSTLTLIEARSELGVVKRLCDNGEFMVEANDLAAVQMLSERRLPFVTGPNVNIYNPRTLLVLRKAGLQGWVAPPEMSRDALRDLVAAAANEPALAGLETEVFAYGRLPLAFSARCFTARHHNLPKDQCGLRCIDDPEGIPVHTQEGSVFLTINGIQTQSGLLYNLLDEWHDLQALGVNQMRISPQPQGTEAVVAALHARIQGRDDDDWQAPTETCNGYWYGEAGMLWQPARDQL